MAGRQQRNSSCGRSFDWLSDFVVTITCWLYFTLGFVFLYLIRYLVAYLFSSRREIDFQRLTSRFYTTFFRLLQAIAPCHRWRIDSRIAGIKSSVIVCNHLSYLDPILLISLLERQKTVVKTKFFKVPVLGWLVRNAGYFPADGEEKFARMMIEQVEKMQEYLAAGGNFFVFPEGTRSRDGKIGSLNRGSLKIARLCRAPIYVLQLRGTEKLFTPGKFFFNTRINNTITLKIVDCIKPDPDSKLSLDALENRIRNLLQSHAEVSSHTG
jgi:1-acyl-sn-glycerol-3-phosphate acyltransferase